MSQDAKQLQKLLFQALSDEEGLMQDKQVANSASGKKNNKLLCKKCRKDNSYMRHLTCDRCADVYHLNCMGLQASPVHVDPKYAWLKGRPDDWLCKECEQRVEKRLERMTMHGAARVKRYNLLQMTPFYTPDDLSGFDLSSDPNFAEVCSWWKQFGEYMRLGKLNQNHLEDALIRVCTPRQQLLMNIHSKLLRGLQFTFDINDWEKQVTKFATYAKMDKEAEILNTVGYHRLPPSLRLNLLKHLMVVQFDDNERFRRAVQAEIKEDGADATRFDPVGKDQHGNEYFYFADESECVRLYRRTPTEEIKEIEEIESAPLSASPEPAALAADPNAGATCSIKIKIENAPASQVGTTLVVEAEADAIPHAADDEASRSLGAPNLAIKNEHEPEPYDRRDDAAGSNVDTQEDDANEASAAEGSLKITLHDGRSRRTTPFRARKNSIKMTESLGGSSVAAPMATAADADSDLARRCTPRRGVAEDSPRASPEPEPTDASNEPTSVSRRSVRGAGPTSLLPSIIHLDDVAGDAPAENNDAMARSAKRHCNSNRDAEPNVTSSHISAETPSSAATGEAVDPLATAEKPKKPRKRKVKEGAEKFLEEQCLRILDATGKVKYQGKSAIADFMKLVPKDDYPDYYKIITKPMSYMCMKRKAKRLHKAFTGLAELKQAFELMILNAKHYNEEGSFIWHQADALAATFNMAYTKEVKIAADHPGFPAVAGADSSEYSTPKPGKKTGKRKGLSTGRSRRGKSAEPESDYEDASGESRKRGRGLTIKLNLGGKGAKKPKVDPNAALLKRFNEEYNGIAAAGPQCREIMLQLMALKDGEGHSISRTFMVINPAEFKKYRRKVHRVVLVPDLLDGIQTRYNTLSHFRLDLEKMLDNTREFYGVKNPKSLLAMQWQTLFTTLYKSAEQHYPHLRFALPPKFVLEEEDTTNNEMLDQVDAWLGESPSLPYGYSDARYVDQNSCRRTAGCLAGWARVHSLHPVCTLWRLGAWLVLCVPFIGLCPLHNHCMCVYSQEHCIGYLSHHCTHGHGHTHTHTCRYGPVVRWHAERHERFKKEALKAASTVDQAWSCVARSIEDIDAYIAANFPSFKDNEDEQALVTALNQLMRPAAAEPIELVDDDNMAGSTAETSVFVL